MKRKILTIGIVALSLASFGQVQNSSTNSQEEPKLKNDISFGFFQFFGGAMNVGYEYRYNPTNAFKIETELQYSDNLNSQGYYGEKKVGFMLQLQYKYYVLADKTLKSSFIEVGDLYLSPFLKGRTLSLDYYPYNNGTMSMSTKTDHINMAMAGVLFGVRAYMFKKLFLDACIGGGMKVADAKYSNNSNYSSNSPFDEGYTGIAPAGNFTIGVRF